MKLVIATPLYPPEIGGPATYAKLLLGGLPAKGIDVELVKFSEVRRLPKIIRHIAYYLRVLKAARNADAVLALDPVSVGLPAMKAAKRAGKPFLVKIVGDYAWEQGQQRFGVTENLDEFVNTERVPFPVRWLRRIQTRVARGAAKVIVPSEYLKHIVTAWGIPEEDMEVIYNAVPLEELGTVPEAVATLPRPLIVTAGRLVPWKHMDGIIDAVARIPDASLAIVGDGPLRVMLARRIRAKLPARAVLTGMLSHRDTLAAVQSAEVFVLNSSYEGLSHLLIEALAFGVPAVATNVGGNPEVITDGGNGLLVPAGDASALSAAVARVLGDDELRACLSARAKESAKRFSTGAMLSATAALLHTL
ncbi:glycosyltransferase family 4 protein [Patescibacteria group bacterium]|nr:glycosyltransferase family 4 protein [Patescibacteria group bacterium]